MTNRTEVPAEFRSAPAAPVTASTGGPGASDKQLAWLTSLVAERQLTDEAREQFERRIAAQVAANEEHGDRAPLPPGVGIALKKASEFIDRLRALPKQAGAAAPAEEASSGSGVRVEGKKFLVWPSIPDGRYALRVEDDDVNPIQFYTVRTSKHGDEWDGFQGLKRHAGDERYGVKGAKRREVLDLIAADPRSAALLFGHETNNCCVCGRELTRRLSRELGIGPICGREFYAEAEWADVQASAREAIEARGEDPDENVAEPHHPIPPLNVEQDGEEQDDRVPCMACGSKNPGDGLCRCYV